MKIGLVIALGLCVFIVLSQGTCGPKKTFSKVHDLAKTSGYANKYIEVTWCLYPDVPDDTKKLIKHEYVVIANQNNKNLKKKVFEIDVHENCLCNKPRNSPRGYINTTVKYIRPAVGKSSTSGLKKRLMCTSGPYVFQQWFGEDVAGPKWEQVKRCTIDEACKPGVCTNVTMRRMTWTAKPKNIHIINHKNCTFKKN